jgi:hypothetical protein
MAIIGVSRVKVEMVIVFYILDTICEIAIAPLAVQIIIGEKWNIETLL